MNKVDTQMLKGVAILMMLWIHLFSNGMLAYEYTPLLHFWNGAPLPEVLRKVGSMCVSIFVFLGGYGLAVTWTRCHTMHNARRTLSLVFNFWLVCLLFIPLSAFTNPQVVPGDFCTLLTSVAGLNMAYNGAWWFLLPYVVLTLVSRPLISTIMNGDKAVVVGSVVVSLLCLLAGYFCSGIALCGGVVEMLVCFACNLMQLLLMFVLGIVAVRYDWAGWFRKRVKPLYACLGMALLLVLKLSIGASGLLNPPFVVLFILLFISMNVHGAVGRMLVLLGDYSANMWLFHYFFFSGVCGAWLFSLRYPLLIFLMLTVLSLLTSIIITRLYNPVRNFIRR